MRHFGLCLCVIVGCAIGSYFANLAPIGHANAQAKGELEVIKTKGICVVDENGKNRIVIGMADGKALIAFNDPAEKPIILLAGDAASSSLTLYGGKDAKGSRMELSANRESADLEIRSGRTENGILLQSSEENTLFSMSRIVREKDSERLGNCSIMLTKDVSAFSLAARLDQAKQNPHNMFGVQILSEEPPKLCVFDRAGDVIWVAPK